MSRSALLELATESIYYLFGDSTRFDSFTIVNKIQYYGSHTHSFFLYVFQLLSFCKILATIQQQQQKPTKIGHQDFAKTRIEPSRHYQIRISTKSKRQWDYCSLRPIFRGYGIHGHTIRLVLDVADCTLLSLQGHSTDVEGIEKGRRQQEGHHQHHQ